MVQRSPDPGYDPPLGSVATIQTQTANVPTARNSAEEISLVPNS